LRTWLFRVVLWIVALGGLLLVRLFPFTWVVVPLLLLVSPPGVILIGVIIERRKLIQLVNPALQSWAFLFGDPILVIDAALLALVRPDLVKLYAWGDTWWWWVTSVIVAVVLVAAFRMAEAPRYLGWGASGARMSPTKLAHDELGFPLFAGTLLYLGVPSLGLLARIDTVGVPFVAVTLVAVWVCLGYMDYSCRYLDPKNQHPNWDVEQFRPLPY
jgi:hypothetical protein